MHSLENLLVAVYWNQEAAVVPVAAAAAAQAAAVVASSAEVVAAVLAAGRVQVVAGPVHLVVPVVAVAVLAEEDCPTCEDDAAPYVEVAVRDDGGGEDDDAYAAPWHYQDDAEHQDGHASFHRLLREGRGYAGEVGEDDGRVVVVVVRKRPVDPYASSHVRHSHPKQSL